MIYALNICGPRDLELSEMMHRTLKEHCKDLEIFERRNLDNLGWGNGAGWEASILKITAIKSILRFGLNYKPGSFLGVKVNGKEDIPKAMKQAGYFL